MKEYKGPKYFLRCPKCFASHLWTRSDMTMRCVNGHIFPCESVLRDGDVPRDMFQEREWA